MFHPVTSLLALVILVSLAPLLRRKEEIQEYEVSSRTQITPLFGYSEHALPFLIYHAFCAQGEDCRVARFVAQMEGDCESMQAVMEKAQIDNWPQWRAQEEKAFKHCPVCSSSRTITKINQSFRNASKELLAHRLGDDKELQVFCAFFVKQKKQKIVVIPATPLDKRQWLRHRSSLVFECEIPLSFRRFALQGELFARLAPNATSAFNGDGAYPWLRLILQPMIQQIRKNKKLIGACAWVRGGIYSDRNGISQPLPAARIAEWLAHHSRIGVDHFFFFDNSDNIFQQALIGVDTTKISPLWLALEPFLKVGKATLAPWPALSESTSKCDANNLQSRILKAAGSNNNKTTQSFYGRPAQYAAQNACHRRLVAAGISRVLHIDVDEFVIPTHPNGTLDTVSELIRQDQNIAAIAMPCVFYGRCDGSELGVSGGLLLDDADCAGKAVLFRQKLIASPLAQYLWVHYVRAGGQTHILSSTKAILVHARFGYALSDATSSRSIDSRSPTSSEDQLYATSVWPRFSNFNVNCTLHAQQAQERIANENVDPLGIFGCDLHPHSKKKPWGWCYCPDTRPSLFFAQAIRTELIRIWGQSRLNELRILAGPLVGPNWPYPAQ